MRFSLLALALLAFAASAQAQSPSFGLKAGLNTATIFFDDEDGINGEDGVTKQARLGFVGGITADVPFTPTLGLRAEALYSQKGYALDFDVQEETFEINGKQTLKLDYLEVPVLLNVMVPMNSGLEIGVQAGVVPAFLISDGIGCSGFESDGEEESLCDLLEDEEDDDELGVKSFDLGAALGLTVGSGPFAVDLRYTYGLTDLDNGDAMDAGFDENGAHNGVFSVAAIYRFGR